MPITNGVKMKSSLGTMLSISTFSHIRKIVKTIDFQGSRFYGNVRNIVSCDFHEINTQHFY